MSDTTINWSEEAEQNCLALALMSRRAAKRIAEELDSQDFYRPFHARLLAEIQRFVAEGREVDPLILSEHLKGESWFQDGDGAAYLHMLAALPVLVTRLPEYIDILKKYARLRRLFRIMGDLAEGRIDERTAGEALGEVWVDISSGTRLEVKGYELTSVEWQTLIGDGVPPVKYISDPYLPEGARIWIWGATGSYKSLWCVYEAAQLSREGVRVSYFSEENPIQEELRRLSRVQPDPQYFRLFHRTGMDLIDPQWVRALLATTEGDRLIFLDSWTDLWSGDESDNRAAQQFDATVLKPLQGQGVTPAVIHHTGHKYLFSDRGGATAGRGASSLGQKADVTLEFKEAGEGRFTIVYGKSRIGGIRQPPRTFQVVDTDDERLEIVAVSSPEELALEQMVEKMVAAILTAPNGRLTTTELRAAVGGKTNYQTQALVMLESEPRVQVGVEKIQTQDGKRRDAKVWRPAHGTGLGNGLTLLAGGE